MRSGMDTELVRYIASFGFGTVILTGGDPLCDRFKSDTYRLIALLKAKGLRVIVNTSAAGMTEEDCVRVIASGVDRVDISIDSHIPEIHNAQRGRHAEAVCAIETLIRNGYRSVVTTTVVTESNAPTLTETVRWLKDIGVSDVRIQRVFLPEEPEGYGVGIDDAMRKALPIIGKPHSERYVRLTCDAWKGGFLPSCASCRMGKELFVCDSMGFLFPCFHRMDMQLGNVFTDDTRDLMAKLTDHALISCEHPACFGKHCVSLFDGPLSWKEK